MRSLTLIGILLTGLGGFILFRGLTYSSQRSVLKLGDFEATFEEKRAVPAWLGGLALVGGLVCLGVGVGLRGRAR
jgi:hypothetical protein